ncbi:carbamoyl-phosphate synthase large subunit [Methylophilaceae bacterium]|nr:carbamoyl-phosphate synthase large subunit [Methylophilaceae bacterium]
MAKRTDIKSILIIGAGPIIIGQACEFDYSGAQACKALMEEGYRVILVNSNPATIMTDPDVAHKTYIEPIQWEIVRKIIAKEKPDALLPTMGGQTALNCALDLDKHGILKKYNVELIGASKEAIDKAEDRQKFKEAMNKIGLASARSLIAHSLEEAVQVQASIGYPAIIRPSFTMGGSGGGIAYNQEEFLDICKRGLDASPTNELLIEESLLGWKEFEMEVVRDAKDNCIIICSIENLDPMGVHTGDSITVAPAQTLTDKEYQLMRTASINVLREVGVETGGSNVQFAINPDDGRMVVIEMNPRVSRSSALASKATGFPIAKIAAKLAVGFTLDELSNDITGGLTPASFEPSIDYVVTKVPRFAFEKFPQADSKLTTQMKSVGEVMAIGRTFQESFQKALRGLEIDVDGLTEQSSDKNEIIKELREPGPNRLWFLGDAFRLKLSIEEIFQHSKIDPWFLYQIKDLIEIEEKMKKMTIKSFNSEILFDIKRKGFSDSRIGNLIGKQTKDIRSLRYKYKIHPVYKRVDTCAAEFETSTAYLYSTYEQFSEANPSKNKKIIILGGGPNRIGQGIEFDYCCVHASLALRDCGYETIMINCNPETVSTDYDTSDRLYFEPVTMEDVMEVIRTENPWGVIVQYGGQTPLKLAKELAQEGAPIIGTLPDDIDAAEDRERFQKIIEDLKLKQPPNRTARNPTQAIKLAQEIGYPLVVRPSYVLGGRAMEIVHEKNDLERYMREAVKVSNESPVLLDRFLNDAIEIDIDAISDGKVVVVAGIMEHIEQAGVHSGDSACSLPPYSLSKKIQKKLINQTKLMAKALNVIGLMNVQFAIQHEEIYVLEVNPRASRTVPFVSKAIGVPLAKIAAKVMAGKTLKSLNFTKEIEPTFFSVKEAVFPFIKFPGVDTILGPEMKSTGEVMGVGKTFVEAYIKSQLGASTSLPKSGKAFISVRKEDHKNVIDIAKSLNNLGFKLVATKGTAEILKENKMDVIPVNKVAEGRPHIVDMIKNDEIDFIVNVTEDKKAIADSYEIRRNALQNKVTYYTTLFGARAACKAMNYSNELSVAALQSLHKI